MPAPHDVVVLPSAPDAWRVSAVDGPQLIALGAGDDPQADHARGTLIGLDAHRRGGQRDVLQFDWRGLWEAELRVDSPQPLDLSAIADRGTLEFDLHVDELAQGGLKVKLGTAVDDAPALSMAEQGRAWVGQGWQHVALPLRALVRDDAELSCVRQPFVLVGMGSGRASVAHVRIVCQGRPNVVLPDRRTESVTPAVQSEWWALDWWQQRHQDKLEEKRRLLAAGTPPQVVFMGDSITQGWETAGAAVWQRHYAPLHALNLGFNGDRTENLLWRLQHGAVDGLAPRVVVLMIGTNNTGHRAEDPQTTVAGIRCVVDDIRRRLPGAALLLLAVFPRSERPDDKLRRLNDRVNQLLARWTDVHFVDVNAALLDADGGLSTDVMPDLLHPNEEGYLRWQRAMAPVLGALLAPGAGNAEGRAAPPPLHGAAQGGVLAR